VRVETLKIAAFWWAGRRHVGRLSADQRYVTPLALGDRAHAVGALALVEAMADGAAMPKPSGAALPLSAVKLDAPILAPRGNIVCVGIGFDPPRFLRRGDRARIPIEGIGTLSNPVE
jgi:2-keto-4-pentenoate hydratase/2-oxohepta-3-ene-1,7-dioic acid hydratase in catechol pathway